MAMNSDQRFWLAHHGRLDELKVKRAEMKRDKVRASLQDGLLIDYFGIPRTKDEMDAWRLSIGKDAPGPAVGKKAPTDAEVQWNTVKPVKALSEKEIIASKPQKDQKNDSDWVLENLRIDEPNMATCPSRSAFSLRAELRDNKTARQAFVARYVERNMPKDDEEGGMSDDGRVLRHIGDIIKAVETGNIEFIADPPPVWGVVEDADDPESSDTVAEVLAEASDDDGVDEEEEDADEQEDDEDAS